jgi:hypothetical protein
MLSEVGRRLIVKLNTSLTVLLYEPLRLIEIVRWLQFRLSVLRQRSKCRRPTLQAAVQLAFRESYPPVRGLKSARGWDKNKKLRVEFLNLKT